MFAGMVEGLGTVVAVRSASQSSSAPRAANRRLEIESAGLLSDLKLGASVSVNGVCLTLTEHVRGIGGFDVVPESWSVSNLSDLRPGDPVNLERSLRVGDRIDGHFVQGHVDGTARLERIGRDRGEYKLWLRPPVALTPYIVRKGSVALDGTSLTVVDVEDTRFSVVLIPTTLERTTLGKRRAGERVNIETDILARLVVNRLEALSAREDDPAGPGAGGLYERLRAGGWLTS